MFRPSLFLNYHVPSFATDLLAVVSMSHTLPALSPSSHLRTTFIASLKEYEKKTKEDLLTHPLLAKLRICNSPTDILAALRTQAQVQRRSTSGNDKLTKWLNPTVNVLYAFSSALIADIGLVVNLNQAILPRSDL